jgi:hypothetical protein
MNLLSNKQFALKMQHKTSFCVGKCCILPEPLLSPHRRKTQDEVASGFGRHDLTLTLSIGGDLIRVIRGEKQENVMKNQDNPQNTVNQIVYISTVAKTAKIDRFLPLCVRDGSGYPTAKRGVKAYSPTPSIRGHAQIGIDASTGSA